MIQTIKTTDYEHAKAMLAWVNREVARMQRLGHDVSAHRKAQGLAMAMINKARKG